MARSVAAPAGDGATDARAPGALQILLTRPPAQSAPLCTMLAAAGHRVQCLPLLDIVALELDAAAGRRYLDVLRAADKAIAISPNAARLALLLLRQLAAAERPQLFAVGPATAQALSAARERVRVADAPYNSESLLRLDGLQRLAGQQIAILCGRGGRAHLQEQLALRGARVRRVELYNRRAVDVQALRLDGLVAPDLIIVLSGTALGVLRELCARPEFGAWRGALLVPSGRLMRIARELGFAEVWTADSARPEDLVRAVSRMG